jgi:hypothetical protein
VTKKREIAWGNFPIYAKYITYVLVSLIKIRQNNHKHATPSNITSFVWNFVDLRFVVKNCFLEFRVAQIF